MGKEIPRSLDRLRSGAFITHAKERNFTNVASLTAAGFTAAKYPGRLFYLSTGGTGSVPCLAVSDGTNWEQVAIGANCI
jgi:hypothetical protein